MKSVSKRALAVAFAAVMITSGIFAGLILAARATTQPTFTPFTFAAAGDAGIIGVGSTNSRQTLLRLGNTTGLDFFVMLGDLAYGSYLKNEGAWCDEFHSHFSNFVFVAGAHDTGQIETTDTVVYDADNSGTFNSGDSVLWGDHPVLNTALKSDSHLTYVDAGSHGHYVAGDTVISTLFSAPTYQSYMAVLNGTIPTVGTSLSTDTKMKYWDKDGNGAFTSPSGNQDLNRFINDVNCQPPAGITWHGSGINCNNSFVAPSCYGREYYFDYKSPNPQARFILISPQTYNITGSIHTCCDGTSSDSWDYQKGDAHYNWVNQTIQGAHASGIPYVFVLTSKDCATLGTNPCNMRHDTQYDTVNHLSDADLFDMLTGGSIGNGVTMLIEAHDHNFQEGKQFHVRVAANDVIGGCPGTSEGHHAFNTTYYATGEPNAPNHWLNYSPQCISNGSSPWDTSKGTKLVIQGTFGAQLESTNDSINYPYNYAEHSYFVTQMGANSASNGHGWVNYTLTSTSANQISVGTNFCLDGEHPTSNYSHCVGAAPYTDSFNLGTAVSDRPNISDWLSHVTNPAVNYTLLPESQQKMIQQPYAQSQGSLTQVASANNGVATILDFLGEDWFPDQTVTPHLWKGVSAFGTSFTVGSNATGLSPAMMQISMEQGGSPGNPNYQIWLVIYLCSVVNNYGNNVCLPDPSFPVQWQSKPINTTSLSGVQLTNYNFTFGGNGQKALVPGFSYDAVIEQTAGTNGPKSSASVYAGAFSKGGYDDTFYYNSSALWDSRYDFRNNYHLAFRFWGSTYTKSANSITYVMGRDTVSGSTGCYYEYASDSGYPSTSPVWTQGQIPKSPYNSQVPLNSCSWATFDSTPSSMTTFFVAMGHETNGGVGLYNNIQIDVGVSYWTSGGAITWNSTSKIIAASNANESYSYPTILVDRSGIVWVAFSVVRNYTIAANSYQGVEVCVMTQGNNNGNPPQNTLGAPLCSVPNPATCTFGTSSSTGSCPFSPEKRAKVTTNNNMPQLTDVSRLASSATHSLVMVSRGECSGSESIRCVAPGSYPTNDYWSLAHFDGTTLSFYGNSTYALAKASQSPADQRSTTSEATWNVNTQNLPHIFTVYANGTSGTTGGFSLYMRYSECNSGLGITCYTWWSNPIPILGGAFVHGVHVTTATEIVAPGVTPSQFIANFTIVYSAANTIGYTIFDVDHVHNSTGIPQLLTSYFLYTNSSYSPRWVTAPALSYLNWGSIPISWVNQVSPTSELWSSAIYWSTPNMVVNPGFETGDLTQWVWTGSPNIETSDVHSGTFAVNSLYSGSMYQPYTIQQNIAHISGTQIVGMSVWYKGGDTYSDFAIVQYTDGSYTQTHLTYVSGWTHITIAFDTTKTIKGIKFSQGIALSTNLIVDDVLIQPVLS